MTDIGSLISMLGKDKARGIIKNMNENQMQEAVRAVDREFLNPHFNDIREKAQTQDRFEAREHYKSMAEPEQEREFAATIRDLAETFAKCRYNPKEGMEELKKRLRDPWVFECLLLIFPDGDHEVKEFATFNTRFAAMFVLPELYDDDEALECIQTVMQMDEDEAKQFVDQVVAEHAPEFNEGGG